MNNPKKTPTLFLFVCLGNSDRSPCMGLIFQWFLANAGYDVVYDTAGILPIADQGRAAPIFARMAASLIGLDLEGHRGQSVSTLLQRLRTEHNNPDFTLSDGYDVIICADSAIAGVIVHDFGVNPAKVWNADIANPWPVHHQEDFNPTFQRILSQMHWLVGRLFPNGIPKTAR